MVQTEEQKKDVSQSREELLERMLGTKYEEDKQRLKEIEEFDIDSARKNMEDLQNKVELYIRETEGYFAGMKEGFKDPDKSLLEQISSLFNRGQKGQLSLTAGINALVSQLETNYGRLNEHLTEVEQARDNAKLLIDDLYKIKNNLLPKVAESEKRFGELTDLLNEYDSKLADKNLAAEERLALEQKRYETENQWEEASAVMGDKALEVLLADNILKAVVPWKSTLAKMLTSGKTLSNNLNVYIYMINQMKDTFVSGIKLTETQERIQRSVEFVKDTLSGGVVIGVDLAIALEKNRQKILDGKIIYEDAIQELVRKDEIYKRVLIESRMKDHQRAKELLENSGKYRVEIIEETGAGEGEGAGKE